MRPRHAALILALAAVVGTPAAAEPAAAPATARIWIDPGPVETKDLAWGAGSPDRQPQAPFTFVQENTGGTVAKLVVRDARGVTWDMKLGVEAHAELIAGRLSWALGFPTQDMYFVREGRVLGVPATFTRAGKYVAPDGTFANARFRQRADPGFHETGKWSFDRNPFLGSRELSGVVLLQALLNNWDTEGQRNMRVYRVTTGGKAEDWYVVKDLGASFGRYVGPQGTPIKWHLPSYLAEPLGAKVEGDALVVNYLAFGTPPTRVPLDHARWFAALASRLTEAQVAAAFTAGGATPKEVDGYAKRFLAKVAELRAAVAVPAP